MCVVQNARQGCAVLTAGRLMTTSDTGSINARIAGTLKHLESSLIFAGIKKIKRGEYENRRSFNGRDLL